MLRYFSKSLLLLALAVVICCVIYPSALWVIGQIFFPFKANGSMILGSDGKPIGSRLIAQSFTKDEYFQSRPSAASYNAAASSSSSLAASNYALRDRVARSLGPIAAYKTGNPAGPDIDKWFQEDQFQGNPHLVAQWATLHNASAQAWATGDPSHGAFIDNWAKGHPSAVNQFIRDNPGNPNPKAADLAVVFFQNFSEENPGKFPSSATAITNGKTETFIKLVNSGSDIQSVFFDMWLQEHPHVDLVDAPGDMVTASGSGLDPHISLENALFQLGRVAAKWASNLKREPREVQLEIEQILANNASAPLAGLAGEKIINVLEINLELRKRYGEPSN